MKGNPVDEERPDQPARNGFGSDAGGQGDLLVVDGLTKRYRMGGLFSTSSYFQAVSDLSFTVRSDEIFGLVGETGSGKSTTGRLVLGLESPTSGRVIFAGHDLSTLPKREMRALRREMQPISQDPFSALNPRMRVKDILAEPFLVHKVARGADLLGRVEELVELVGLSHDALTRFPHQFSGGQRQRLVIARAIALRPRFIVADEPLSALDVSVQAQIINLLHRLQRELRLSYLFISHDLAIVKLMCDSIGVLYMGRMVEIGTKEDIFTTPSHPYTHALLAAAPVVDPSKRGEKKKLHIQGEPSIQAGMVTGCVFQGRCPMAQERCLVETPVLRSVTGTHMAACHFAPVDESSLVQALNDRSRSAPGAVQTSGNRVV